MKTQPQRMCIACKSHQDKSMLTRVVKQPDGTISFDETGKLNGRGAYVCKNSTCVEKCIKAKLLNKHLGCEIPQTILDSLPVSH